MINPVKQVTGIAKSVVSMTKDYSEGIWIGRRAVLEGNLAIGTSLSPGIDGLHWAVMINGQIYQVNEIGTATSVKLKIDTNWNGFEWTLMYRNCSASKSTVEAAANAIANSNGY